MLKYLPLFILLTSCQAFSIKDSDTIEQAELKVVHVMEEKMGVIHHEAEPPMITSPAITKAGLSLDPAPDMAPPVVTPANSKVK